MLNKINYYQFDNLINNRVPFLFFNLSEENIASWYTSLGRMHIETYEVRCAANEVLSTLQDRQAPKDYAILLLCSDGATSLKIHQDLAAKDYTDVYVVDGGAQQMMTEKGQL